MDLAGEVFDMAGSAARVATQFLEGVMEGPANAMTGGSEEQKAQVNARAAAREQAKARAPRRQADRPADHSAETTSMKRALELLEGVKREKQAAPVNDDDNEQKKKRDRHRGGDRER